MRTDLTQPGIHRRPTGSIVVVVLVAAVLLVIGGISVLMSTHFGRADYHEGLVSQSREIARSAVDEASLLINNGKRNVEIDKALGSAEPVEVPIADVKGGASPLASIPEELRPKVFVKASVVNQTTALHRESARQQMLIIEKFELPSADSETRKFWQRVEAEGLRDKETGEDRSQESPNVFVDSYVKKVGVQGWGPKWDRYPDPEFTDADGVRHFRWKAARRMPELAALFALFRTATGEIADGKEVVRPEGQKPSIQISTNSGKPSLNEFATKWRAGIEAVALDAARKVEACGANPSLAMAHLVGDLKVGEEIASGAEVAATAAFMKDSVLGLNKTYLLEITAKMGYGGAKDRMKGQTAFRTYRLFQKAEWEDAMTMMAAALSRDLQDHGAASLDPGDLAKLFPANPDVEGRNEPVPDRTGQPAMERYDPKAMLDDIVYSQMPSTVGARLYPYGIASLDWDPDRPKANDRSGDSK